MCLNTKKGKRTNTCVCKRNIKIFLCIIKHWKFEYTYFVLNRNKYIETNMHLP